MLVTGVRDEQSQHCHLGTIWLVFSITRDDDDDEDADLLLSLLSVRSIIRSDDPNDVDDDDDDDIDVNDDDDAAGVLALNTCVAAGTTTAATATTAGIAVDSTDDRSADPGSIAIAAISGANHSAARSPFALANASRASRNDGKRTNKLVLLVPGSRR
jgi:hypothetical protein